MTRAEEIRAEAKRRIEHALHQRLRAGAGHPGQIRQSLIFARIDLMAAQGYLLGEIAALLAERNDLDQKRYGVAFAGDAHPLKERDGFFAVDTSATPAVQP